MSGYHWPIAPSSLARTVQCPAWISLSEGLPPEKDDEEAQEGNAADWVAKQYANGNEVPYGTPIPLPGDYTVDYDMIHGAKMWTRELGYGAVSNTPVLCERIHPECGGEPDGWRADRIEQILRMPDYKYGFGIVEVFENWQLIAYAVGILSTLELIDSEWFVEFKIVQPRAHHKDGPVRKWKVRADKLRGLVNTAHMQAVRAVPPEGHAVAGEPIANTGPECLHCPARLVCTTFQKSNSYALELSAIGSKTAMTPAAVGVQLLLVHEARERLKAQAVALEAQAEAFLRAGQSVPMYGMQSSPGALAWNADTTADELIGLGDALQKNLRKTPGALNSRSGLVITPTQAIKAGIDETVISQYATRSHGAMKLARITTDDTRRIFGENHV